MIRGKLDTVSTCTHGSIKKQIYPNRYVIIGQGRPWRWICVGKPWTGRVRPAIVIVSYCCFFTIAFVFLFNMFPRKLQRRRRLVSQTQNIHTSGRPGSIRGRKEISHARTENSKSHERSPLCRTWLRKLFTFTPLALRSLLLLSLLHEGRNISFFSRPQTSCWMPEGENRLQKWSKVKMAGKKSPLITTVCAMFVDDDHK